MRGGGGRSDLKHFVKKLLLPQNPQTSAEIEGANLPRVGHFRHRDYCFTSAQYSTPSRRKEQKKLLAVSPLPAQRGKYCRTTLEHAPGGSGALREPSSAEEAPRVPGLCQLVVRSASLMSNVMPSAVPPVLQPAAGRATRRGCQKAAELSWYRRRCC